MRRTFRRVYPKTLNSESLVTLKAVSRKNRSGKQTMSGKSKTVIVKT